MRVWWMLALVAFAGCMDGSDVPRGPDADERDDGEGNGGGNGGGDGGGNGGANGTGDGTAHQVDIEDFAYAPATLEIVVGDSVTWTNQDQAAHTATAQDDTFDSGTLTQGASHTETFEEAGTVDYVCTFHPQMTGTIVVS